MDKLSSKEMAQHLLNDLRTGHDSLVIEGSIDRVFGSGRCYLIASGFITLRLLRMQKFKVNKRRK